MKKQTKTFLFALGGTLAGVSALAAGAYFATKKMVAVALERDRSGKTEKSGKFGERLCGFAYSEAYLAEVRIRSEALCRMESKTVEIEGYDGTRLVGHYFPHPEAKRLVVAVHGWRSHWSKDFALIADFWMENDCSILFVEQRGQGESGGDYMGFGLMERFDAAGWAKWASENITDSLPIYLAGVSMGAASVLMASSLSLPKNVRGIIADSAFTSPHDIWKHVAEKNLRLSYGLFGRLADGFCRRSIGVGSRDFSTVEALKRTDVPILFIHGSDDHFVPVKMCFENYKACAAEKRLFIVPGAEHTMSLYGDRAGYERALESFWKEFDRPLPEKEKAE